MSGWRRRTNAAYRVWLPPARHLNARPQPATTADRVSGNRSRRHVERQP